MKSFTIVFKQDNVRGSIHTHGISSGESYDDYSFSSGDNITYTASYSSDTSIGSMCLTFIAPVNDDFAGILSF